MPRLTLSTAPELTLEVTEQMARLRALCDTLDGALRESDRERSQILAITEHIRAVIFHIEQRVPLVRFVSK